MFILIKTYSSCWLQLKSWKFKNDKWFCIFTATFIDGVVIGWAEVILSQESVFLPVQAAANQWNFTFLNIFHFCVNKLERFLENDYFTST
jgi:hypothetical protein